MEDHSASFTDDDELSIPETVPYVGNDRDLMENNGLFLQLKKRHQQTKKRGVHHKKH